jgi:hypothetical protein
MLILTCVSLSLFLCLPAALLTCEPTAAKQVTACDFMAVSIEENRRQHEALGNVDFLVADVTEMEQVWDTGAEGEEPVWTAQWFRVPHTLPGHMHVALTVCLQQRRQQRKTDSRSNSPAGMHSSTLC